MAQTHFKKLDEEGQALNDSLDHIFRITLLTSLLAIIIWGVVSLLRWLVHHALDLGFHQLGELLHSGRSGIALIGLLIVMGVGGVIRGILSKREDWAIAMGDGMDIALENYHLSQSNEEELPPRYKKPAFDFAAKKFLTTFLTLGAGSSGGLESPVVSISESISAGFSRVMQVRSDFELRTYQLAGISAAVSTLLGAPFTAALFATEIVYGDRIIYRNLAYSMWAGVIAYILNNRFHGFAPLFLAPEHPPEYSLYEYGGAALVGLAVSVPVTIGFAYAVSSADRLIGRVESHWHAVLTSLTAALFAWSGWFFFKLEPHHILGMGEETLTAILSHDSEVLSWKVLGLALLGKVITTGLTMRGGGSAGLLVPSMYFGGVAGALTAVSINSFSQLALDPALFAVVGIASSLVSVIGVPLASIALVLEVFGPAFGPPTIIACGVTYLITLRIKIYKKQYMSTTPEQDEVG